MPTASFRCGPARRLVEITNRSLWPDDFVVLFAKMFCKNADIGDPAIDLASHVPYHIVIAHSTTPYYRASAGGRRDCVIRIPRRDLRARTYPFNIKDPRFSWSEPHTVNSHVELFLYFLAHEIYHATHGHPSRFKRKSGTRRTDVAGMEFRCNKFAMQQIEKARPDWASHLRTLLAGRRRRLSVPLLTAASRRRIVHGSLSVPTKRKRTRAEPARSRSGRA